MLDRTLGPRSDAAFGSEGGASRQPGPHLLRAEVAGKLDQSGIEILDAPRRVCRLARPISASTARAATLPILDRAAALLEQTPPHVKAILIRRRMHRRSGRGGHLPGARPFRRRGSRRATAPAKPAAQSRYAFRRVPREETYEDQMDVLAIPKEHTASRQCAPIHGLYYTSPDVIRQRSSRQRISYPNPDLQRQSTSSICRDPRQPRHLPHHRKSLQRLLSRRAERRQNLRATTARACGTGSSRSADGTE